MTVRAVLFDLDGTLHDRATSLVAFAEDQFQRLGLEPERKQDYIQHFVTLDANGKIWKDQVYATLREEFALRGNPTVNELVLEYLLYFPRFALAFADAHDVIVSLRQQGIKVGIITNGRSDLQRAVSDALGLTPLVDVLIVSADVNLRKPDRAIFALALDQLSVLPEHAVMVGDDAQADIAGAVAVGIRTIAFRCPEATAADAYVQTLTDALTCIAPWLGMLGLKADEK